MAGEKRKLTKTLLSNTVLAVFGLLALFLLVPEVEAGGPFDKVKGAFDAVGGFKTVGSLLGLSVAGWLGLVLPLKKAVDELMDVVACIKSLSTKYKQIPELKTLRREIDEALEAAAQVFERIPTAKKYARRLRALKS